MERPVSDLLDPSCGVPPDIVFKIIDPETKTSLGEVGAHKTILSLRVPVFQRQFHGEFPSPACVTVEDSTLEAFRMFIGHIYQAKEDWTSLPLNEIFQIAALAEKYFLTCLMEKVLECLNNISINDDNIIETATVAEQFHLPCSLFRFTGQLRLLCKEKTRRGPIILRQICISALQRP